MARWGRYSGFPAYVPVAERKERAAKAVAKLAKKKGFVPAPVIIEPKSKTIASTAWGKAWCTNLESYSDYENRLPRGRTYVRNGSVVDLQISAGRVTARVSGTSLYTVEIDIVATPAAHWKRLQKSCAGQIDSLVELLRGTISSAIMNVMTSRESGLFPAPSHIAMDCSCPDGATMCKHVAAALYGVGARLDHNPELLFTLRRVDPTDLIASAATKAGPNAKKKKPRAAKAMDSAEMADVFGIDLE